MAPYLAEALVLTCHAASQLSGSYMPLEILETSIKSKVAEPNDGKKIFDWCEFEWSHFIETHYYPLMEETPHKGPLHKLLLAREVNLAREIFIHVSMSKQAGAMLIGINDERYPRLLKKIENPPLSISVLGRPERLSDRCVGIVGARKASLFAIRESYDLGFSLAKKNICVVSGGAYGCDIASHQGVLALDNEHELKAIVVFAGGLSKLYPVGNERVFSQLLARGAAFISERLWHKSARPHDFPIRNRMISGLANEVVLMEARKRSGSMSTCRTALDQGREVLVMSPSEENINAEGSLQLMFDGAYTFHNANDLMSHYDFLTYV